MMCQARRWPGFVELVGGVFTFGAPRIGNAESAAIVAGLYPGRFFRYMHGSDMVSRHPLTHPSFPPHAVRGMSCLGCWICVAVLLMLHATPFTLCGGAGHAYRLAAASKCLQCAPAVVICPAEMLAAGCTGKKGMRLDRS